MKKRPQQSDRWLLEVAALCLILAIALGSAFLAVNSP